MSGIYSALGRIGRDAEVRQTQNGTSVANIPIAVDVGFGENKQTMWLDSALFGKRAEGGLIQYLVKGQQVHVIGELGTRQFQKRDGTPGFAVTLKIVEIDLAGSAPQQGGQQPPQQQGGHRAYGNQPPQQQAPMGGQQPPQQPQQPQQPQGAQGNYGAPDPGSFNDFDDEIPF